MLTISYMINFRIFRRNATHDPAGYNFRLVHDGVTITSFNSFAVGWNSSFPVRVVIAVARRTNFGPWCGLNRLNSESWNSLIRSFKKWHSVLSFSWWGAKRVGVFKATHSTSVAVIRNRRAEQWRSELLLPWLWHKRFGIFNMTSWNVVLLNWIVSKILWSRNALRLLKTCY